MEKHLENLAPGNFLGLYDVWGRIELDPGLAEDLSAIVIGSGGGTVLLLTEKNKFMTLETARAMYVITVIC